MPNKNRHHLNVIDADETTKQLTPRALTRQEFGRRLANLIVQRGWNQSDLARAADMGRDSISSYVNGRTFPTPRALQALATALNVDPSDLLPNSMMNAIDDDHPAIELKQASGHPGKAWLRINRAMSFDTAAKIITLLNSEDGRE